MLPVVMPYDKSWNYVFTDGQHATQTGHGFPEETQSSLAPTQTGSGKTVQSQYRKFPKYSDTPKKLL